MNGSTQRRGLSHQKDLKLVWEDQYNQRRPPPRLNEVSSPTTQSCLQKIEQIYKTRDRHTDCTLSRGELVASSQCLVPTAPKEVQRVTDSRVPMDNRAHQFGS